MWLKKVFKKGFPTELCFNQPVHITVLSFLPSSKNALGQVQIRLTFHLIMQKIFKRRQWIIYVRYIILQISLKFVQISPTTSCLGEYALSGFHV